MILNNIKIKRLKKYVARIIDYYDNYNPTIGCLPKDFKFYYRSNILLSLRLYAGCYIKEDTKKSKVIELAEDMVRQHIKSKWMKYRVFKGMTKYWFEGKYFI